MAYEHLFSGEDDDVQTQRVLAQLLAEEGPPPKRGKQSVLDRYPPGTPGPERGPSFRHVDSGASDLGPTFEGVTGGASDLGPRKPISMSTLPPGPLDALTPNPFTFKPMTGPAPERAPQQQSYRDLLRERQAAGLPTDSRSMAEAWSPDFGNVDKGFSGPHALPGAQAAAAAGRGRGGGRGGPGGPLSGAVAAESAGGGQSAVDPWEAYRAGLQKQRAGFDAQLEALNKPPDYTELQRQMRQRGGAGSDLMAAAAISGLGPAEMQGMRESILKRAEGMYAPQKVEGGVITAEGEVQIDPMYQHLKKKELIEKRIAEIDKRELSATTAQEKAQLQRERNDMLMMIAQMNNDTKMAIAGIVAASKRGEGGGGEGVDQLPPKLSTADEQKRYAANRELLTIGPQLMADVKANPGAFGWRLGAAETVGGLPGVNVGQSQVPMLGKPLSEKETVIRGQVYNRYSKIMNERIGAAQTKAEEVRLRSFIPPPGADADTVYRLMAAGLADAAADRRSMRQAYPGMGPDRLLNNDDQYMRR